MAGRGTRCAGRTHRPRQDHVLRGIHHRARSEFAAENVGYFTSPYAQRAKVAKPVIDRQNKTVQIKLPNGVTRTAKHLGDQGCVTLPVGKDSVNFTPHSVKSALPDASKQPWPMGDVLSKDPLPTGL